MSRLAAISLSSATTENAAKRAASALPVGLVAALALVIGFQPMPRDPDLWFHLAGGEHTLQFAQVPETDPFSFTRQGETWVPHSWLFDVGIALGWRHLGPRATESALALVFAATMLIVFHMLRERGVAPLLAVAVTLTVALAAGNARGPRPQVCSLLLCTVVIALLARRPGVAPGRLLVSLPLVFLLWAQLHAACVMGLIVVAVWWLGCALDAVWNSSALRAGRELVTLAGALALSAAAVCVTPHRMTHFAYVALTGDLEALRQTEEWQAPQLLPLAAPDFFAFALVALVISALARSRRRCGFAEIGLCAALLVLSFTAVRHIPLAWVAAVPLAGSALGRGRAPGGALIAGLRPAALRLSVVLIVLMVSLWNFPTSAARRYAAVEPVAGARALAELEGTWRVFTTYNTGGFVLHTAPQRLRVFIDSRADVYGDELFAAMRHAQLGRGWEELFGRWDINAAVLERTDPLVGILREHADWRVLAEDASAVTFIRADAFPRICFGPGWNAIRFGPPVGDFPNRATAS